jgi:hypothetical protein
MTTPRPSIQNNRPRPVPCVADATNEEDQGRWMPGFPGLVRIEEGLFSEARTVSTGVSCRGWGVIALCLCITGTAAFEPLSAGSQISDLRFMGAEPTFCPNCAP